MKRLSDFLDVFDGAGLWCTIWYIYESDEPLWKGSFRDISYWIAAMSLPTREEAHDCGLEDVIMFRGSGEEAYKDRPGLVIIVTD